MVTVKMTKAEYEAYLLYLKSVDVMRNAKKGVSQKFLLDEYLSDPVNVKEIEAGLEDIKAGRISYVDPDNLWESIE